MLKELQKESILKVRKNFVNATLFFNGHAALTDIL